MNQKDKDRYIKFENIKMLYIMYCSLFIIYGLTDRCF